MSARGEWSEYQDMTDAQVRARRRRWKRARKNVRRGRSQRAARAAKRNRRDAKAFRDALAKRGSC